MTARAALLVAALLLPPACAGAQTVAITGEVTAAASLLPAPRLVVPDDHKEGRNVRDLVVVEVR